jgi:hypothetical protein
MWEEELKGGELPVKPRPKVQTTKACIVSMEYTNKNKDGTPKLSPLGEMYSDAAKVKQLFENTLGWE